jgi:hypothetical protein
MCKVKNYYIYSFNINKRNHNCISCPISSFDYIFLCKNNCCEMFYKASNKFVGIFILFILLIASTHKHSRKSN